MVEIESKVLHQRPDPFGVQWHSNPAKSRCLLAGLYVGNPVKGVGSESAGMW